MEKFIGKKVLITVAFANLLPGGATPGEFIGILEKIDDEFLEFSNVQRRVPPYAGLSSEVYKFKNYGNTAIINRQCLIMIVEA